MRVNQDSAAFTKGMAKPRRAAHNNLRHDPYRPFMTKYAKLFRIPGRNNCTMRRRLRFIAQTSYRNARSRSSSRESSYLMLSLSKDLDWSIRLLIVLARTPQKMSYLPSLNFFFFFFNIMTLNISKVFNHGTDENIRRLIKRHIEVDHTNWHVTSARYRPLGRVTSTTHTRGKGQQLKSILYYTLELHFTHNISFILHYPHYFFPRFLNTEILIYVVLP